MASYTEYLIPLVVCMALLRVLVIPAKAAAKLVCRGLIGFLCLTAVNLCSSPIGLAIPVNAVTVLVCGVLGLPGAGVLLLLEGL